MQTCEQPIALQSMARTGLQRYLATTSGRWQVSLAVENWQLLAHNNVPQLLTAMQYTGGALGLQSNRDNRPVGKQIDPTIIDQPCAKPNGMIVDKTRLIDRPNKIIKTKTMAAKLASIIEVAHYRNTRARVYNNRCL